MIHPTRNSEDSGTRAPSSGAERIAQEIAREFDAIILYYRPETGESPRAQAERLEPIARKMFEDAAVRVALAAAKRAREALEAAIVTLHKVGGCEGGWDDNAECDIPHDDTCRKIDAALEELK